MPVAFKEISPVRSSSVESGTRFGTRWHRLTRASDLLLALGQHPQLRRVGAGPRRHPRRCASAAAIACAQLLANQRLRAPGPRSGTRSEQDFHLPDEVWEHNPPGTPGPAVMAEKEDRVERPVPASISSVISLRLLGVGRKRRPWQPQVHAVPPRSPGVDEPIVDHDHEIGG